MTTTRRFGFCFVMLIPGGHKVKEISSENQEVINTKMGFHFKHIEPPPESLREQKRVTDLRPIASLVPRLAVVRCRTTAAVEAVSRGMTPST